MSALDEGMYPLVVKNNALLHHNVDWNLTGVMKY